MRYLLTTIFSFFIFQTVFSQIPTDFYFKNPLPAQCKELKKSPNSFIGVWKSKKDTLRSFIITETEIYSRYKHLMVLSRAEFNKAGLSLKSGFVYGFSKTDSLPAYEKNDTIVFCYIKDHEIIRFVKETGNEFLAEVSGGLILSQKLDSFYRYTLITLKNGELILSEVDHEPEIDKVLTLTKAETFKNKEDEIYMYLADVDKKKMEKFISQGYFNDIQHCERISD